MFRSFYHLQGEHILQKWIVLKVTALYKYVKVVKFFKMCKSKTLGSSVE